MGFDIGFNIGFQYVIQYSGSILGSILGFNIGVQYWVQNVCKYFFFAKKIVGEIFTGNCFSKTLFFG